MKMRHSNVLLAVFWAMAVIFILSAVKTNAAPPYVNYQGRLTDLASGDPVTGSALLMVFRIYDEATGGNLLWEEQQTVDVIEGIYSVVLGSGTTTVGNFDLTLFSSDDRWFEVVIDGDVLDPRHAVNSVPFALKAGKADDSDTLEGFGSSEFALTAHTHAETDPTVPANIKDGISWSELSAVPSGFVDGVDDTGILAESDPTVPINLKDGVSWSELSAIPSGFVDGVDDTGILAETDPTVPINLKDGVSWSELSGVPSGFVDGVDDTGISAETDPTVLSSVKDGVSWGEISGKPSGFADGVDDTFQSPFNGTLEATGDVQAGQDLRADDDLHAGDNAYIDDDLYVGDAAGNDGRIYVEDGNGTDTIYIDADYNEGGVVFVKQDDDRVVVELEGDTGGGGRVIVRNGLNPNYATINLYGNYSGGNGRVVVNGSQVHDYAEYFDLTDGDMILPGMVVVIDTENRGHLRLSTEAYDKKVAGIISGAGDAVPGFVLGSSNVSNEDKPLAVSGRVYCLVDATQDPVEIGDLLTTSDTPGHAMKVTDNARSNGAIVGKAMEPLAEGKGLILVLVSLN